MAAYFGPETVCDLLDRAAAARPDDIVLRIDGGDDPAPSDNGVTVGRLAAMAEAVAGALAGIGIRPGDRVAILLSNGLPHAALCLGLLRLGAVWVPVNPAARGPGLAHILATARPVAAIAEPDACPALAEAGFADDATATVEPWPTAPTDIDALLAALAGLAPRPGGAAEPADHSCADAPLAGPLALRCVIFTSGTTGPPKGAMVTDRMLVASAAGTALACTAEDGDRLLMWEPLYHIGGIQVLVMALRHRVSLVLVPRFSASRLWAQVRGHGVTKLHYLGGILEILLKQPPRRDDRDHPVRLAFGGGCRPQTWRAFEARFGIPIREVYGQTEASSFATINRDGRIGCTGTAVPWFDLAVLRPDGRPAGPDEPGEMVIAARQQGLLTPGYLGAPDATAEALRPAPETMQPTGSSGGPRFHTGDLMARDGDGFFRFLGRLKDALRRRGENISAWEVEQALMAHPDIAEAAVVGVDAEIGEQEILAFLRLRDGTAPDLPALHAWATTHLPRHHVPRYWKTVPDFPRTPSQRVRKDGLDGGIDTAWDAVPS